MLPYGIAASKQNEEEFLVSTEVSLYYGADGDHIYARYCTSVGDSESEDVQYVTNGIDVQVSYKVCEDPSNKKNMLVLNTDFGLIKSTNRGKSKTPTIYVATFNYGFYVSKDGGKTFTYLVCESYIL